MVDKNWLYWRANAHQVTNKTMLMYEICQPNVAGDGNLMYVLYVRMLFLFAVTEIYNYIQNSETDIYLIHTTRYQDHRRVSHKAVCLF